MVDYGLEDRVGRRGHLCFGRFCDMRVGTIVANSLNILFRLLYIILASTSGNHYPYRVSAADYCTLVFSVLAIVGALKYNLLSTASGAIGLTWVFLPRLGESEVWYMFLLDCMTVYPTIVMTYELYIGIMSKDEQGTTSSSSPSIDDADISAHD